MSGIKSSKWIRVKKFEGLPTKEDVEIVVEELPELKDGGQFVCTKAGVYSRVSF